MVEAVDGVIECFLVVASEGEVFGVDVLWEAEPAVDCFLDGFLVKLFLAVVLREVLFEPFPDLSCGNAFGDS